MGTWWCIYPGRTQGGQVNPETHAGILVAAPASSLTSLLTFLALLSLGCLGFPKRELRGLEGRSGGGGCRWGPNLPSHPILFCSLLPRSHGEGVYPAWPPQSALGCLLIPAGWPDFQLRQVWAAPRPARACSPGSAPLGAHATLLSLNSANICCAPTVSQIRASLPPTSPPPPSPSRSAWPVSFVTAAAEAQAPRERPERSRRMAGSDTGLPGGSRGNGGWRPLKRDQSRPAELELRWGVGSPRAGLSLGL